MLPEPIDLNCEHPPDLKVDKADDLLEERLEETFPASDPLATGKFE